MDFNHLRYLAIGDSLTVGIGVPFLDPGYVEYYKYLSQQILTKRISYQKHARSGATTEDILAMLNAPIVREAVKCANVITITGGGNDLINAAKEFLINKNEECISHAIKQSGKNISKILEKIHHLDKQEKYILRLQNLYNPFSDIPIADEGIRTFNSLINRFGRELNVKVADIYSVFKGNEKALLSSGGIHPNSRGYYQMAIALSKLGYSPL
ncbi:GDSL-type esterase/lipase family protein [Lysinibacillus xylanilyticus]|uniref:GDSL-type esterase/lipase family protein n=1 Tax=Lysinibacillus xylanilyticus TaxID=582475 RepID=UPI002B2463A5|nr:GDSL-type esterase/lipase family protein [Lysinibacillus xylanilyticus]MEB2281934.1 GDSL-type esterase/lipase family protein [Lysinibacillus xylanilyticus]